MNRKFETPWANISDLMAGLMMVFLFISVAYSFQVRSTSALLESKNQKITDIAGSYTDSRVSVADSLEARFSDRYEEWGATLDRDTLTFRFNDPALLFEPGSSELTEKFQEILSIFWIEYIDVLSNYTAEIREVKIEGHTSSEWYNSTLDESYFNNMRLSQQRTRSTLEYCYFLTPTKDRRWVRSLVTANGMSFSRPVLNGSGEEDIVKSRRVEFTIIVDSRSTLEEIGRALND